MCSAKGDDALPSPGFPIRKSMDITPAFGSPWLIADCYVLHRLLVPRHPPCALFSLIANFDEIVNAIRISQLSLLFAFAFFFLSLCSCQGAPRTALRACGPRQLSLPCTFGFFLKSPLLKLMSLPFGSDQGSWQHLLPVVGSSGLEPPTSRLSGVRSNHLSYEPTLVGGDERVRTADPLLAKQVLSRLSYTPVNHDGSLCHCMPV
jgi:hypothetical protein